MRRADLDFFKYWFKQYVARFYAGSSDGVEPIMMKEQHTKRVCREILSLGRESGLAESDLRLAETAALFHDVGRFSQWHQYRTFIDGESEDHALLALKVISKHGVLEGIPPEEREVVHEAIRHHNLKELPAGLAPRHLFFARLLRDADKLDIWRLSILEHKRQSNLLETLAGNLPADTAYSKEIVADLKEGKPSNFSSVRNRCDIRLLRLGWIFDLNFAPSCLRVLERRYVQQLCTQLPANREIKELEEYLTTYLESRVDTWRQHKGP